MTYIDLGEFRIRADERCWKLRRVSICQSGASKGQELETFVGDFVTKDALCRHLPERVAREALASGEFAMMDALSATMLKACEYIDSKRIKGRAA